LQTLIEMVEQRAVQHPMRVALITGERLVTYGELWARIMAVAKEFADCGIGPGDRVLLVAPSVPAFVFGYLATHFVGAVAVVLDPNAPTERRDELIRRAAPKLVFAANAGGHPEVGRMRSIAELEALPLGVTCLQPPSLESLADLLFTTGTTGRPKGVRLTHRNLAAAARHINMTIGNDEDDVEVVPLPLYHSFGLGRLRCNLIAGATVVLVEGFRLPGEIFSAIERHHATGLVGVPAGFAVLLRFGARGLGPFAEQLRYVEIGSAPMPLAHKRALMELLPRTALWMHYGLTEASRSAFLEFHRNASHLDSIGTPAPDVAISIRRDNGSPCSSGEAGLLWIGGSHVSPGYWDDSDLTAASFRDGWVCTGDIVHSDESGFLHLHGRSDDMINVGGFNVSPDEVEQVLATHPSVQEAACIGIPDPRDIAGQVVRAYLVFAPGRARPEDAELSAWAAAHIESYKIPLQYRWIDTLPRTASGKLLRASLRSDATSKHY
jgi:long-chain acyl-CoA synthetase